MWGKEDRAVAFRIGERQVPVADASTYRMEVDAGAELVQDFPISAGSPDDPGFDGPHAGTELDRHRVVDSSTNDVPVDGPGGCRTPVECAVRLSDNGEFGHAAPTPARCARTPRTGRSPGTTGGPAARSPERFPAPRPGN